LGCLLLVGVSSHSLRQPVSSSMKGMMIPKMVDLDGIPEKDESPTPTFKPKYTEFSPSESPKEGDEKSYKPEYMKGKSLKKSASVTKGFCAEILADIKAKKAPYYIHGEFTGELRKDLIEQCGMTVCNWGVEYKKLVQTCDSCPSSCDGDFDPADFFNSLLTNEDAAAPIIQAILHISKSGPKSLLVSLEAAAKKESTDPVAPGPTGLTNSEGYPLKAKEGGPGPLPEGPAVTAGFCLKVIKDISAKVAPYFIDGVFTGECRKDLIDQCGEMVCGWSNSLKQLLDEKKSCDASSSGEYLESLMKDSKACEKISMFAGAETGDEEA